MKVDQCSETFIPYEALIGAVKQLSQSSVISCKCSVRGLKSKVSDLQTPAWPLGLGTLASLTVCFGQDTRAVQWIGVLDYGGVGRGEIVNEILLSRAA